MQSADLYRDPRVRYPQCAGERLRSMLAAPLIVGEQAIGALTVLRTDVHHFSAEEESLVSAFADQAAMALEHARLFSSVRTYSERLEAMVASAHPRARRAEALRGGGAGDAAPRPLRARRGAARDQREPGGRGAGAGGGRRAPAPSRS